MRRLKIAAIVLVMSAGVVGSYFIVKNSTSVAEVKEKTAQTTQNEIEAIVKNPIQWVEKNISPQIANLKDAISSNGSNQSVQPENNFTSVFSGMILSGIQSKNTSGLTQKAGEPAIFAPSEDILSQEWLDKFLSSNPPNNAAGDYHPKVDESRFKISQDVSNDSQLQYIKELEDITQKYLAGFNKTSDDILNEITQKQDTSSANQLADVYGAIADDAYEINVPANWVDFQKAFMSHFYSSQSLWKAVSDFQNDPLRALLASQFIPNLEDSAKGLQGLLAQGIEKNNLKF